MRTKLSFLSVFIILLTISGCGPDFNTDFDPPKPDTKLTNIFPEQIDGMRGEIHTRNISRQVVDVSYIYGRNDIIISVIQFPDKIAADSYFKSDIVPDFDKLKNHFRGNINGHWKANGTDNDGRKFFSWVNQNWVFFLNGRNNNYFKMAVDAFKYVEE